MTPIGAEAEVSAPPSVFDGGAFVLQSSGCRQNGKLLLLDFKSDLIDELSQLFFEIEFLSGLLLRLECQHGEILR